MVLTKDRQLFYERLKYTILDSTNDELDEILRTLIKKDNASEFYEELFWGCSIDGSGEIVRDGFFFHQPLSVPLEYAMYTLLAYAPEDFPLKVGVRSIRFLSPERVGRISLRFPRRLDFFPRLEQLGLVGWSTSKVPKELANCHSLKYLSLRNNGFTELPEAILKIPQLTHLDLSENQISQLPADVGSMMRLKTLSLKGNKLSAIPPGIGHLRSLESLDLSCNMISHIPETLKGLKKLSHFSLAYNNLDAREEASWESLFPLSS